jgi:hypothetical protein
VIGLIRKCLSMRTKPVLDKRKPRELEKLRRVVVKVRLMPTMEQEDVPAFVRGAGIDVFGEEFTA